MAQIDMKNATVQIRDGGSNTVVSTGTVTGTNAIGAVTIAGTYSATPVAGGLATINGRKYVVAASPAPSISSITLVAPGLLEATQASDVVSFTAVVNMITLKIGEGTLTYNEKRNMQYTLDRGRLDEVREGDEVPMDVKFDVVWDYIKGSSVALSPPSPSDAMKKIGNASAWVSSDTDACKPYAVDLVVTYVPACTGDQEEIILPDFRYEDLAMDLKAGTISCSGKCNAKQATVLRG
jgi:hypothetical protein